MALVGHPVEGVEACPSVEAPAPDGGVQGPGDDAVDVSAKCRDGVSVPPEGAEALARLQVPNLPTKIIYPNNSCDVYFYTRLLVTRWVKLSLNFELLLPK